MPEIESAGRVKRCFDVLLWGNQWSAKNATDLGDIEELREYLRSLTPSFCGIRLLVPRSHEKTIALLEQLNCRITLAEVAKPDEIMSARITHEDLATAVQTALSCDADALVITNEEWFPYIEDIEKCGVLLSDTGFIKQHCEIFARGRDVPWSFSVPIWNLTWTGFYQTTESTLRSGMEFLHTAAKKNADKDGQETGRSLVHNRLPNICFTRDRLLFYEISRLTSIRGH